MTSSAISLNDLIKAFVLLQPNDIITRTAVAEFLGFSVDSEEPTKSQSLDSPIIESVGVYDGEHKQINEPIPEIDDTKEVSPSYIPIEIKFISQDSVPTNISVNPIPKPSKEYASSEVKFEPLIGRNVVRALILTILTTISQQGDLDLNRIIELLSQNKNIDNLPRLKLSTLRRGVQILVDVGESMTPYRRDQVIFQSEVRRVLGSDNTAVLRFIGTPLKGVKTGRQLRPQRYEMPRQGRPILLLTDFGIGQPPFSTDPASLDEWMKFIYVVKRSQCPLIALVPYTKNRWPNELLSSVKIVQWDRCTRLIEVRKQFGKGHLIPE